MLLAVWLLPLLIPFQPQEGLFAVLHRSEKQAQLRFVSHIEEPRNQTDEIATVCEGVHPSVRYTTGS
jgi:hypothetical protein